MTASAVLAAVIYNSKGKKNQGVQQNHQRYPLNVASKGRYNFKRKTTGFISSQNRSARLKAGASETNQWFDIRTKED